MAVYFIAACGHSYENAVGSGSRTSPKTAVAWAPGDDIPGWEGYDYDCPLYESADAAVVYLPDIWWNEFQIFTLVEDRNVPQSIAAVIPADCTDFS